MKMPDTTFRIPVGHITCTLQTPIYIRSGEQLEETKKYIERGTTLPVYLVEGTIAQIDDDYFIKDINRAQFKLNYGELMILGEEVKVYSRGGVLLRKVKKGMRYKIRSIIILDDQLALYGISENEFISSEENIHFMMGSYITEEDILLINNDKSIQCSKGEKIDYKQVKDGAIQLLDGSWVRILNLSENIAV
ncbi:TPA: hypothetical protein NJY08_004993 [Salmonella enterica subsp. enterica serovar Typhi str. AG3]|nr:hypothetical protein [Salmonella enterica subsp. enterica serovar Typhi str. AG3]